MSWTLSDDGKTKLYMDELPEEFFEKNWTDWVFRHKLGAMLSSDTVPDYQDIRIHVGLPGKLPVYINGSNTYVDSIQLRTNKCFVKAKMLDELMQKSKISNFQKSDVMVKTSHSESFVRHFCLVRDILNTGTL